MKRKLEIFGSFENQDKMLEYLKCVVAALECAIKINQPFELCAASDEDGNKITATAKDE